MTLSSAEQISRQDAWIRFETIRRETEKLCQPLAIEDYVIQTAAEVSPAKWHLAHVSWFYETFILVPYANRYPAFHPLFAYIFNSYYEQVGQFHPRAQRGLLSRPTVEEVYRYRAHVDTHMKQLIETSEAEKWPEIARRLLIGLHHEQQHQELLLTDIKHNFATNPLNPAYRSDLPEPTIHQVTPLSWLNFPEGLQQIGFAEAGFAYDNERPRHPVYVNPFHLASRLVTNEEYLEFVAADGYKRPELWLSDGWRAVHQYHWQAPLYWEKVEGEWSYMTLGGRRPLAMTAPVCHVSYYEAEAFARWAGKRLPTEVEWEVAVQTVPIEGNLRESDFLHPIATDQQAGLSQMYGDVWEWTQSPYTPYPGYHPPAGALGEYNGKFMCNQMVLRGGACVTPISHIRPTYRNFFYPHERWQFKGFRLAGDLAA